MSKLRVQSFAVSIDGYGAGPNQDLQNPLGVRGSELMEAFFATRTWRAMHGQDGGETGVDNELAEEGFRPIFLGSGEHLWRDLDVHALGYACVKVVPGERATHVLLRRNL